MDGLVMLFWGLIVAFLPAIIALVAVCTYVGWYRSRFRRELPSLQDPEAAAAAASTGDPHGSPSSKELLLYFVCLRNQSERALVTVPPVYSIGPIATGIPCPPGSVVPGSKSAQPPPPPPPPPPSLPPPLPYELAMWQGLRVARPLFTADDREEENSEEEETSVRAGEKSGVVDQDKDVAVPSDGLEKNIEAAEAAAVTPCGSTPFYTPMTSERWEPNDVPAGPGSVEENI